MLFFCVFGILLCVCWTSSRRVAAIRIDSIASKEIPKKVSATAAAGAEQLRAYTSEKVPVHI